MLLRSCVVPTRHVMLRTVVVLTVRMLLRQRAARAVRTGRAPHRRCTRRMLIAIDVAYGGTRQAIFAGREGRARGLASPLACYCMLCDVRY
eukprot:274455-Rhodomonas_salina.2